MTQPVKPAAPGDDHDREPSRPTPRSPSLRPAAPGEVEVPRRSPAFLATLVALPVALIVGLLVYWNIGGFESASAPPPEEAPQAQNTAPVEVSAEALAPNQAAACRDLLAILPQTGIREAARRAVVAAPDQNAAFGDPPITLTCGGAGGLNQVGPTDVVYALNNVCWMTFQFGDHTLWTTADRQIPVAVRVPSFYEGPAQWVIEFSNPIEATIAKMAKPPAGCATAKPPTS